MLDIQNLHAGYGGLSVLRGIAMRVGAGEVVAVLGSNGVGKTTLNNAICGFVPISRGEVHFLGEPIHRLPASEIVSLGLVQVPEGRLIFPNLTVLENLELGSYRRARANRRRNLDRVLEWFPRLRERSSQLAGTLSGGEQQMLATGRGLMTEPKMLILDEPSLGLSPLMVREMFQMIRRIRNDGVTVILVEQNVAQSLAIADRAYVLEQGVFSLSGAASEIASDDRLKKAYLGL